MIAETLRDLRWQDFVDVGLITLVLWRVYGWLKGTVALQVAVGMLTLVAAAFAAGDLGLVLTEYVLQAIGAVAVLIAVVIFKDELRRGLGRASPLRWWRERRAPVAAPAGGSAFQPLAEGLFGLARERIGALVVVPRRDPLDDHLTGGTPVDALTSPPILAALFHPASPVHDGAAVVDTAGAGATRIRIAGAFLPLSVSTALPQELGTRHRAAVGISERCDALALAVSEERGEVSLAVGGAFTRVPPSAAALARRLDELMRESPRAPVTVPRLSRERRRRQLVRDMIVRILIFAGVVGAWHGVAGERGSVIVKTVPVELRGVPQGLDFDPPQPNEVELVLRGPRRLLMGLGPADLHAVVDLSGDEAVPGPRELPVAAAGPSGIGIVRVTPPVVKLELLQRRALPVRVARGTRLPRTLRVVGSVPETVEVVGRDEAFRNVDELRTRPVEGAGASAGMAAHIERVELVVPTGLRLVDDRERQVVVLFEAAAGTP